MYNPNENAGMGWDDVIEDDGGEYILLEKSQYPFVVEAFERGRTEGSDKLPPSNMAKLTLRIDLMGDQSVRVFTNLILHSKTEWRLSQFFTSIGQKKKGEPLRMDWSKVIGATGICEIDHREYNGNMYNDVKKFIAPKDYEDKSGWKPGSF